VHVAEWREIFAHLVVILFRLGFVHVDPMLDYLSPFFFDHSVKSFDELFQTVQIE
jgi:hypothetical protein